MRVVLETGPKGKRVVAFAPDWPGLERGAKTADAAIERLLSYLPRYAPVAEMAGMGAELPASPTADVVERYEGTGSTDFWGISFTHSSLDRQPVSPQELERELALMRACWAFFDAVRARVSAELRVGPRGGGRDRDRVVRHTVNTERDWAKKLGLPGSDGAMPSDEALAAHRDAYCAAIREHHAQDKTVGPVARWSPRFLIRHTAFHTLDHAWEMEDRDVTAA